MATESNIPVKGIVVETEALKASEHTKLHELDVRQAWTGEQNLRLGKQALRVPFLRRQTAGTDI